MQASIVAAATELGIDHHVVGPGDDFETVVRDALERGADLLAAAGGDGTVCAVAGVAMQHDVPIVVVPAGTRNHFALDLGLDLGDPVGVLRASLGPGYERRVDVGTVNGATFLNNASIGLYPTAASRDDYRGHKVAAFVGAAREAMHRDRGGLARLSLSLPGSATVDVGETTSAVMVVNNAYAPGFAPGTRLRPRLDAGEVWLYVGGALDLASPRLKALVNDAEALVHESLLRAAAGVDQVTISSDRDDVPIALDGETRPELTPPFAFRSRPGALRLHVPTDPRQRTLDVNLSW
jgi:diacylglycerol kinase family enzyme